MIFRPVIYVASIVGLTVLLIVVGLVLERFAGISLPGSVSSAVVPMIAAMIEGQAYVTRAGTAPEKGAMWKAAGVMTLINIVVSGVLVAIFAVATGVNIGALFAELGMGLILIAALVVVLLYFFMSRIGYGMGVNAQIKAQK